jgi:hypothetical protein
MKDKGLMEKWRAYGGKEDVGGAHHDIKLNNLSPRKPKPNPEPNNIFHSHSMNNESDFFFYMILRIMNMFLFFIFFVCV